MENRLTSIFHQKLNYSRFFIKDVSIHSKTNLYHIISIILLEFIENTLWKYQIYEKGL